MFIERTHHPTIEFDPAACQQEPTLTHFFSTRAEPLETALPLLAEAGEDERVLVVSSPLSELVDGTIRLHRHEDFPDRPVVDQQHRAFFEAVRASLMHALEKIDAIEFAALDDDGGEED